MIQLEHWTNHSFGDNYINRNKDTYENVSSRLKFWSKILSIPSLQNVHSILECGCNIGINLHAIKHISQATLYAIEPYKKALDYCIQNNIVQKENAFHAYLQDMSMFRDEQIDFVFTSGVLIHVAPEDLKKATDNIVRISKKYIMCSEYFNATPVSIPYHGSDDLLFKRDFGKFYLDNYNLRLLDYGFEWKEVTGLDNCTWWLFEKI